MAIATKGGFSGARGGEEGEGRRASDVGISAGGIVSGRVELGRSGGAGIGADKEVPSLAGCGWDGVDPIIVATTE